MARPIAKHQPLNGRARLYGSYGTSTHVSQKENRVIPPWNPRGTILRSLLTLCGAISNENLLYVQKDKCIGRIRSLGKHRDPPRQYMYRDRMITLTSELFLFYGFRWFNRRFQFCWHHAIRHVFPFYCDCHISGTCHNKAINSEFCFNSRWRSNVFWNWESI